MALNQEGKITDPRFIVGQGDDIVIPQQRTKPFTKILHVTARGGIILVISKIGSDEREDMINRSTAIKRAIGLQDMLPYLRGSDYEEVLQIVEKFVAAIDLAKKQDSGAYTSTRVSMAVTSMNPKSALNIGNNQVASGHQPLAGT